MGQWLSDRTGQPFVVENRAGASGNIGTEVVAKAAPDGYTLLQIVTPHAINAALHTNLTFDFVPGYEASGFAGIGAPRYTPAEIIAMLNKEINAALADSKIKARITELGGTPLGGSPAEFGAIIAEATDKWARVIRFAGIKAE